jgi:hypothetical protein
MSADDAWGLNQRELHAKANNREAILAELKRKLLQSHKSPAAFLEAKYPSAGDKEQYAQRLWQELPPVETNPPVLSAHRSSGFGKPVGSLTADDVCVVHLAAISFQGPSMVCEPTVDKVLKLADEILTDGFVTDTEPLLLNVTPAVIEQAGLLGIPPWGETVNGYPYLRAFSLCHHKSAVRVIALHLLLNVIMEEPQLLVWLWHDT